MKTDFLLLAVIILIVAFSGCKNRKSNFSDISGHVTIDGSSSLFLLSEAISNDFTKDYPKVSVDISISGTLGGFKKFCKGETDINDASRPIDEPEKILCNACGISYLEIPVAYDGIVLVTSRDNAWIDYLTLEELKLIWQGDSVGYITRWKQVRPDWPDEKISLFGPGKESGTYNFFCEAVLGKTAIRHDYLFSEDDNVLVEGVVNNTGSLGFFGMAYYEMNKQRLKLIPVAANHTNKGKDAVLPSVQTIENNTYKPLSRTLFIYVSQKAIKRPEVKKFVVYYLENAAEHCKQLGYVPLAEEKYKQNIEIVKKLE